MKDDKKKLLSKTAYLYYIENKTQNEIAEELNIYRTTISRMLKQARDEGIVDITINNFDTDLFLLERHLKKKYKLKDIIIVPNHVDQDEKEKDNLLAKESAAYVRRIIKKNDVVGLAWGSSLANMAAKIENFRMTNSIFVPLVGGPSHINSKYHVNTIAYDMARCFGGKSIFVNATVVQESEELRDGIINSRYFDEIKAYWEKIDIALVGIGGHLSEQTSKWRDLLTEEDREDLKLREAVGDCCCQFFDEEGKILKGNLYNRTVSIPLERLQKVPYAIGIARGEKKVRSILAMLKRKYINVLVTDEETIVKMLKISKDPYYKDIK